MAGLAQPGFDYRQAMKKNLAPFLWLCFTLTFASARAEFCPSPETIKAHGVPVGFSFVPNNTEVEQHSKVYSFDTALFDQASALIKDEGVAESEALSCRYDASITLPNGNMPFFIIRPVVPDGMIVRVRFNNTRWGGFCWEPGERQTGCVVVCHYDHTACPFEIVPAD